jgi:hypothetical protein
MPKIITRAEAKALGLKRYFTGKPCKRGHVCERTFSTGCMECHRAYKAANREKMREYHRAYKAANREKMREYHRAWRAANPEYAEYYRAWRAANPEKRREYMRQWAAANPGYHRERGRKWYAANAEYQRERSRQWAAANPGAVYENTRRAQAAYRFMRDILLEMGLITKEDSPKEQRGLVSAYVKLGLLNREEIEEWLNTQTLKKA